MDIKEQLKAIEEMQSHLTSTYDKCRDEDEKFLRTTIAYFHLNMTKNSKLDTAKIKADAIEQTHDIIDYMDSLYKTNQIYYDFIQKLSKELEAKS